MRLTYIQILRLFAATSVVLFHSIANGRNYTGLETSFFRPFDHGDLGVDLFFVISGFIIYYSTHQKFLTPWTFLRRRVERIVPIYWILTVLFYVLLLLFPAATKCISCFTNQHLLKSLLFVSFTDGEMPVIYPGWSLEYEMFFYAAVTFLLFRGGHVWRNLALIFALAVTLSGVTAIPAFVGNYKFFFDPLLLEFVFGVFAAQLFLRKPVSRIALAATLAAVGVLLIVNPTSRVLIAGLPATALVFAAAKFSQVRIAPSFFEKVLATLGDASYSIYLVQFFFLSGFFKLATKTAPGWSLHGLDGHIILSTATIILAGYIFYALVEKPILGWTRKNWG